LQAMVMRIARTIIRIDDLLIKKKRLLIGFNSLFFLNYVYFVLTIF
jgi:hypothetical protein